MFNSIRVFNRLPTLPKELQWADIEMQRLIYGDNNLVT